MTASPREYCFQGEWPMQELTPDEELAVYRRALALVRGDAYKARRLVEAYEEGRRMAETNRKRWKGHSNGRL